MKEKKQIKIFQNIEISDVAAEGMAIARIEKYVVFVPYAAPGDIVDIQIVRKKKNFMEGIIHRLIKPSDKRVTPVCKHFGICGGCKWQHLPYLEQLNCKKKQVVDSLTRIGKLSIPENFSIKGSDTTEYYRNKLEFTFSDKRWLTREEIFGANHNLERNALGFHIPGMFDKVLDIETCYLQHPISNKIRNSIKCFAIESGMTFFSLREQKGFLRNLTIRNTSTGEWMLTFSFFENNPEQITQILKFAEDSFPEVNSIVYFVNSKKNDSTGDLDFHVYKGTGYITETLGPLKFIIGPKSFYQTNSFQAYALYSFALNFAGLKGNEIVYDLYTGTGTIACFFANYCKKVIGIEYVEEAVADARLNAMANEIHNAFFFSGDMKDVLKEEFVDSNGKPDVIITDPPRAGMHPDVVNSILKMQAGKIIYVSCNPATQARDLAIMAPDYSIVAVQAVDMFPHTHHVENVVLLQLKEGKSQREE